MQSSMGGTECSAELQLQRTRAETLAPAHHMACPPCISCLHQESPVMEQVLGISVTIPVHLTALLMVHVSVQEPRRVATPGIAATVMQGASQAQRHL